MLVRAFLTTIAHGTSGAARIQHSLRPLNFRGRKLHANLGRNAPRECGYIFSRHRPRRRATQYSRDVDDRAEKPRRTGSPAFADDDSFGRSGTIPVIASEAKQSMPQRA